MGIIITSLTVPAQTFTVTGMACTGNPLFEPGGVSYQPCTFTATLASESQQLFFYPSKDGKYAYTTVFGAKANSLKLDQKTSTTYPPDSAAQDHPFLLRGNITSTGTEEVTISNLTVCSYFYTYYGREIIQKDKVTQVVTGIQGVRPTTNVATTAINLKFYYTTGERVNFDFYPVQLPYYSSMNWNVTSDVDYNKPAYKKVTIA